MLLGGRSEEGDKMKIVFLHGLGQRAADWGQVASQFPNTDCPELFEIAGEKIKRKLEALVLQECSQDFLKIWLQKLWTDVEIILSWD